MSPVPREVYDGRLVCLKCRPASSFPIECSVNDSLNPLSHLSTSSNHHRCKQCPQKPEFLSAEDLENHRNRYHPYCGPCNRPFDTSDSLQQHATAVHNTCHECGDSFNSPSNLKNHQRVHAPKNVKCPGCPKTFDRDSAMMLHLEAGSCSSGVTAEEVDDIANECYQSRHYISDDPDYDFCCPTCQVPFLWMSGALQHAESDACSEGLAKDASLGKFLHFLRRQISKG
ncbi:hypothetical protein LY76DRAFT_624641 [Colletotrichum caudatum]|nr:hypothetical protein LY76DRAFT_624641 [Colletotrichum caudatum]